MVFEVISTGAICLTLFANLVWWEVISCGTLSRRHYVLLSAALLATFIAYVVEDRTYILGSGVRNSAMVAGVERQGGYYRSCCHLKSVAMDKLAHRKVITLPQIIQLEQSMSSDPSLLTTRCEGLGGRALCMHPPTRFVGQKAGAY